MQTTKYKAFILIMVFLSGCLAVSCSAKQVENEQWLKNYLDEKETRYENISVEMGTAYWNYYSQEAEADLENPKKKFQKLMFDPKLGTTIETWYKKKESIKNPVTRRRIAIWYNTLITARVEMEPQIHTLRTKLEKFLGADMDKDKKPSAEKLREMVLTLMKMRNKKAKELGYANYAELILEITELDARWFHGFVENLLNVTEKSYKELIVKTKEKNKLDKIGYVEISNMARMYRRNKGTKDTPKDKAMNLLRETVENIGFDADTILKKFIEMELPASIGGQGIAVKIPTDIRIVVVPGLPLAVRLHEAGHGLHGLNITMKHPMLKGYEWWMGNDSVFPEGLAETIARFENNKMWQQKYLQVDKKKQQERD
ncbi:MAG: hypothetical protein GY765_27915, partial [bacterium]|nr:hypothetical protein [bacterium]